MLSRVGGIRYLDPTVNNRSRVHVLDDIYSIAGIVQFSDGNVRQSQTDATGRRSRRAIHRSSHICKDTCHGRCDERRQDDP
jgi:hypothetical protein